MRRLLPKLFPLFFVGALFIAVWSARPTPAWRRTLPNEPYRADHCTWYCHNHNCLHQPVLPGSLTSDRGAFGLTIETLRVIGASISRDRAVGYGLANLLIYCVGWPVGTYALWLLALKQGQELARRKREQKASRNS